TVKASAQEAVGGAATVVATVDVAVFGDIHTGNANGNAFEDRGRDDRMLGLGGNDDLYGDTAPAGLIEGIPRRHRCGDDGCGHEELHGGEGNATLHGGEGNDTLFGDAGNDRLYGDSGDDTFFLGTGNDDAWGGAGNDLIVFGSASGNNNSFDG